MPDTPRQLRSNTDLQSNFTFPSNSPARRQRNNQVQEDQEINIMAIQGAQNAAPVVPAGNNVNTVWSSNPNVGNYNPGTRNGQEIFKNKTKGMPEEKKFQVLSTDAEPLKQFFVGKSTSLGGIVTRSPIEYNDDGTVKKTANLITQHQLTDLEILKRQAHARYKDPIADGDPIPAGPWTARVLDPENDLDDRATFYDQVHSNAVAELIKNTITPSGMAKILQGKLDDISFIDPVTAATIIDGPCFLYLIMDRVDPSLAVNVENLREDIENARMHTFGNDVDVMLTFIEGKYQKILDMNKSCESLTRYTLRALVSGPDADFNTYIKAIKGDVDAGVGQHASISFNELVTASRKKYQNMVAQGEYGKLDAKSTQIMALTTEIQHLKEELLSDNKTALTTDTSNTARTKVADTPGLDKSIMENTSLQKWRLKKIGAGKATIICDGKEWWWCTRHVDKNGRWDGMYVRHQEKDHDAVQAKFKRKAVKDPEVPSAAGEPVASQRLVVGQKLREVLCSRLMVGDADADAICADICSQVKD